MICLQFTCTRQSFSFDNLAYSGKTAILLCPKHLLICIFLVSQNFCFLVKDKARIQINKKVPEVKNENTRAKRHQVLAFCLDGGQSYFMVALSELFCQTDLDPPPPPPTP